MTFGRTCACGYPHPEAFRLRRTGTVLKGVGRLARVGCFNASATTICSDREAYESRCSASSINVLVLKSVRWCAFMLCLDTMTLVERVHVACVVVRDERISSVSHYTLLQCMQTCMKSIKMQTCRRRSRLRAPTSYFVTRCDFFLFRRACM